MSKGDSDLELPPSHPAPKPPASRNNSISSFTSIDLNHSNNFQNVNNNSLPDEQTTNVDEIIEKSKNGFDLNRNLDHSNRTDHIRASNDKMSHKPEEEGSSDDKKDENIKPVKFFHLFKYASTIDKVFMGIGSCIAIVLGFTFPAMVLLMGHMTDTFIEFDIFNRLANGNDSHYRELYFSSNNLSEIHDDMQYYEKIEDYYKMLSIHTNETFDVEQIRSRLGLSIPKIVQIFNDSIFQNGTMYRDDFKSGSAYYAGLMGLLAIAFAILDYFALSLWELAARNQIYKIKLLFFRSVINQDIEWFDKKGGGDFASKITNNLNLVQQGMGDKIALTLMSFSTLLFSLILAFYHGWELTLVSLAIMPVLAIAFTIIGKIQTKFAASETNAYSKAGAIAEEVINLIRTVYAFGGQEKELKRYEKNIEPARNNGIRRSMFTGISLGLMYFSIYASYGISFWYGVKLILRSIENKESPPKYQASTMLIVFFNVLMGAFSLGQTSPYFEAIARACGAAGTVFSIMKQKPKIDSLSQEGYRPNIRGRIEFRNVHFSYPTRKNVKILNGLSLEAQPGQTIALVGSSGCGKSTIIQLIQRFYDPEQGTVLIDGQDIKELNVGSLRDQIGVVGQEPVLFGYSIEKNIGFGHPEASHEEIVQAAKEANAYDFIQNLPDKFNTLVGERGAQLSGGQKQRIAIARALIRKPKILLLDESTSALDSESEAVVQAALDKASVGRTTFIVAHRLSTIRNANKIIVIDHGEVKEIGTHQELVDKKGIYYNMARLQNQDKRLSLAPIDMKSSKTNEVRVKFERTKSLDTIGTVTFKEEQGKEKELRNEPLPVKRLFKLVMPDKIYLSIATLFSFLCGLTIPIYSFLFGDVLGILADPDTEKIRNSVLKYSLIFLAMGIVSGILQFFQNYLFGISSENLTYRLRKEIFGAILKQEIGWFDHSENNTGALCARLSNDASAVQGATGSRLSIMAQTVSILTAGVVISMIYCWKLSLVMLLFVPVIIISVYFQMKILMGMTISKRNVAEEATKIAVESITNIRTVASLHLELTFWINFQTALEVDFRKSRFEPHIKSLTFGFTQMTFNCAYAIALFYGSRLILAGDLDYSKLFKSTEAVLFGTNMIGQSVAFSSDYQKGKVAAVAIFRLLDRVPRIVVNSILGLKPPECRGEISFSDVEFRYPSRPQARVLKRITFEVKQGQTIALVGSSGCGKSTCTQILERFYDFDHGKVQVDNEDIHMLNIGWLRSQIGIVSQEPLLFDKTIEENIAYGDNSRNITMEEIVRAAQQANIHDFIKGLPQGYQTPVGDKGAQLSGGQKQRIAIARALIRNPRILLLDEATSALDSESEKIVQQALDEARHGRTCLIIAHRLSTIRDVDQIFVIEDGYVAEQGTHDELLEQQGIYYQMYMAQCSNRA